MLNGGDIGGIGKYCALEVRDKKRVPVGEYRYTAITLINKTIKTKNFFWFSSPI